MFFRRLAASLQRQDWTAVFLEFVIVVVGVFIGVQVSNWNAGRQDRVHAESYRSRIMEDVRTDVGTLDGRLRYYTAVRQHAEAVIAALESPDATLGQDFLIDVYQATQVWQYRESSDTYNELTNSGKIDLFADPEIRAALAEYYRETEVMMRYWLVMTDYRDLVRRYLPYDIQRQIREACEIVVPAERETSANELVDQCDPKLSEAQVARGIAALLDPPGPGSTALRLSANRHIADVSIKLDLFVRKQESAKKLLEEMAATK